MMSNVTITSTVSCFTQLPTYSIVALSLLVTPLHFVIIRVLVVRFRLSLPRHKILLCLSISDNLQILGIALIACIGLKLQLTVNFQSCQGLRQVLEVVSMQNHCASTGFILLLAIERYIACIHSLRFHTIVTPSRANFAVVFVWVISILGGLLALHPNEPNNSDRILGGNARILLVYIITVLVSSVFLTVIQSFLYRLSRTKLKVVPHNMFGCQKEKDDLMRRQFKLIFATSAVTILYVVCMCPMACLSVYLLFNPKEHLTKAKDAVAMLALLNTFSDPFIYGFGMADVRQGIKREWKKLKQRIFEIMTM